MVPTAQARRVAASMTRRVQRLLRGMRGLLHDLARRDELDQSWGGPFNGQAVRLRTVSWLVEAFGVACAVETGTYRGTTTAWLAQERGLRTYSVEANPRYFAYAWLRFLRDRNAQIVRGDSRRFLRRLTRRLDPHAPTLFYLDAHWNRELPLREELEIILRSWRRPVIVIDDFRVPWDEGYGWDDYGNGASIGPEVLPPLEWLDCFLPSDPSSAETGARRGCAVLTPQKDRAIMSGCPGVRPWGEQP